MNPAEKLALARSSSGSGVDVIEAGFPIASPGEFEAVQAVAEEIRGVRGRGPRAAPRRPTSRPPGKAPRRRGAPA